MVAAGIVIATVTAWAVGRLMIRAGPRLGFEDPPDDSALKVHRLPTVPLGGMAVLTGLVAGYVVVGGIDWLLIIVATLIAALGLIDDRFSLKPSVRLGAEVALSLLTIGMGVTPVELDISLETAVAVLLVVVAINAVNLFDGLDGLAASSAIVSLGGLALLYMARDLPSGLPLLAAGALLGFLVLNLPPARLFLGDNGAYLVGFLLAVSILRVSPSGLAPSMAVAGLALGVFLMDLSVTVLRRRLSGWPLFSGDRNHVYDRLHRRGWSVGAVAAVAAGAQLVFVGLALVLETAASSWWQVAGVAAVCLVVVFLLAAHDLAGTVT